jgi:hypothetical protein
MHLRNILSGLLLGALPFLTLAQDDMNVASLTPPESGSLKRYQLTGDCTGVKGISPKCSSQESAYQRDFFYIGGGYVDSGIPGQQMWTDQLYVEKLTPARKVNKPYPMNLSLYLLNL